MSFVDNHFNCGSSEKFDANTVASTLTASISVDRFLNGSEPDESSNRIQVAAEYQARILVVDDDENNLDMLGRRLERNGYQVDLAHDGYEALVLIDRSRFHLVLLDVMMPGIDGIAVLREEYLNKLVG